jgi:hypothetical protein
MRKIVFFLVFLFWTFFLVSAWAADIEKIIARAPYTDEEKAYLQSRVSEMIEEVASHNLPTSFLFSKLKEGVGKKVKPYILLQALEKRKEALFEAKKILDEAGIGGQDTEKILTNLAISLELAIPASLLQEVVQKMRSTDPQSLPRVVESLSVLHEVGITPERVESVTRKIVTRNLESKEISKVAALLERSRRSGVDVERTATVLEEALQKYDNFNLVEMEVRQFIAASRPKPALSSGQGVTSASPGISGTTPTQEGGGPLESSSSGHPPTQEGGTSLE